MNEKLLGWLNSVNAKYAEADPLFNEGSFGMKQEKYKNVLLPKLEETRRRMLNPNWQPNDNWWGSKIIENQE